MRLREIMGILKDTELSQIFLGENDSRVISLLNLAIIDVYAKFSILQEEQVIQIEEGKTRYRLQDNSQKVLQVYMRDFPSNRSNGDDSFVEVPINDINDDESVFTPQPFLLHVPNPIKGRVYSVMQIVTPPFITDKNIDELDFLIPPQLLEPIVNYAAWRAYKAMNGDEKTEISSHYRAYMASCNEVLKKGLNNESFTTNLKHDQRGF